MNSDLKELLEIQEYDMQMKRLMDLKRERVQELEKINAIKNELHTQVLIKEGEIIELKKNIRVGEGEISEVQEKIKKFENQQSSIKKVEEFNALSQEMSHAEREKLAKEQRLSDMYDKMTVEEDILNNLKKSLAATTENSELLEKEIRQRITMINDEGRTLKQRRDQLVSHADPEAFRIYERLLRNKKDRVIVPIENRCCSGCHIMLTAQDENLVRKGERLVFCEHCSRIHYWRESEEVEGIAPTTKPRRRRSKV